MTVQLGVREALFDRIAVGEECEGKIVRLAGRATGEKFGESGRAGVGIRVGHRCRSQGWAGPRGVVASGVRLSPKLTAHATLRDSDRGGSLGTPVVGAVGGSTNLSSFNTSQAQSTESGEKTGTAPNEGSGQSGASQVARTGR